jgi:hypothetical protein
MTDLRERRMSILHRVESGELSPEDGNYLLAELEEGALEAEGGPEQPDRIVWQTTLAPVKENPVPAEPNDDPPSPVPAAEPLADDPPQPQVPVVERVQPVETGPEIRPSPGWRGLWALPFLLGLFLTLVSVNWMYLGYAAAGLGWGFWLSFFPLALGIGLMWAGWEMRKARWLHLRVRQQPGQKPAVVSISLPLPIGLTRWAVQHFGKFSPGVNGQNVGDILDEMDQALSANGPMHIYVDGDRGEKVELWIDGPAKNN